MLCREGVRIAQTLAVFVVLGDCKVCLMNKVPAVIIEAANIPTVQHRTIASNNMQRFNRDLQKSRAKSNALPTWFLKLD